MNFLHSSGPEGFHVRLQVCPQLGRCHLVEGNVLIRVAAYFKAPVDDFPDKVRMPASHFPYDEKSSLGVDRLEKVDVSVCVDDDAILESVSVRDRISDVFEVDAATSANLVETEPPRSPPG